MLYLEGAVHFHQQLDRLSLSAILLVARSKKLRVLLTRHLPRLGPERARSPSDTKQQAYNRWVKLKVVERMPRKAQGELRTNILTKA